MSETLAGLLGTAGDDPGCDGGLAVIAQYAELELEGRDARGLFPGFAAHLRNCPACAEDYAGLVELVRAQRAHGDG